MNTDRGPGVRRWATGHLCLSFLSVFIAFKKTFGATQPRPKDLGRHLRHLVIDQAWIEAASDSRASCVPDSITLPSRSTRIRSGSMRASGSSSLLFLGQSGGGFTSIVDAWRKQSVFLKADEH
jgi:hypothetical protein